MANKNLHAAKKAKKDEFYTQLTDIERELQHYWPHFRGKVVLCNCDDPYESNFFKYFALRFNQLGLKKLICTCYDGSPVVGTELQLPFEWGDEAQSDNSQAAETIPLYGTKRAYKVEITQVDDRNGDGAMADYIAVKAPYVYELPDYLTYETGALTELDQLAREILRKYCFLVQSFDTRSFTPTIRKAIRFIDVHYADPELSLQTLASTMKLNKCYLASAFRKETGGTVTAYINEARIRRACLRLNSSAQTIGEIAAAVGIPNVNYFTRLFKKQKNVTPSEYRKMIRS